MSLRRLIAILGAAIAALAAASPAGAIVGGGNAPIQGFPYQVALLQTSIQTSNWNAQFCGGAIRDEFHIITAGHCVFDSLRTGQVARPSDVAVLAGTSTLSKTATAGRLTVREISVNPDFDSATLDNDSAVITLDNPLTLASGSTQNLISPVTSSNWQLVMPGNPLVVSGWGDTNANPDIRDFPVELQEVSVPLVSDATCEADYAASGSAVNGAVTVCAGDTVRGGVDACQGDSGGPLVRAFGPNTPEDYELVGIVSSGIGCGEAAFPGLYTEVAAPIVRNYITQNSPTPAPELQTPPSLTGTAEVGSTLTCTPGTWSGSPTLTVQWVGSRSGSDAALTGIGAPADYAVQAADVGSSISCIVRARNAGGRAIVRTPASGVVPQPAANVEPAAPVPGTPVAPTTPPIALDTNAPVARIRTARCVRTTCTITLNVTDAGFSAGVAKVTGSVRSTYRRACVKNGRRTTCTRHRTRAFTARRTAATRFTVKLTKLPVGTQLFTLLATDKAGHRQLLPTRTTLRTRR